MNWILLLLTFSALLFVANAWKTNLVKKESTFNKLVRQGYTKLANNLKNQQKAQLNRRGGRFSSVRNPLSHYIEYSYVIPIEVGTPSQKFNVYADMTTADFWLAHTSCVSLPNNCDEGCESSCHAFGCMSCCGQKESPCEIKHKFDNTSSKTYQQSNQLWEPNGFGDTPIYGYYGKDTVTLTDGTNKIPIPETNIELATFDDGGTIDAEIADGVLGLAFKEIATKSDKSTVLENAIQKKLLDKSLFAIWLDKNSKLGDVGGQISFGQLDDDHCQNEQTVYIPLFQHTIWDVYFDYMLFNDKAIGGKLKVLTGFDINTPNIRVPYETLSELIKLTGAVYDFNNGGYTVDCATKFTWSLKHGDNQFTLTEKQLVGRRADLTCLIVFEEQSHFWPDVVLGQIFMQEFCTSFDLKQYRIGIAPLK